MTTAESLNDFVDKSHIQFDQARFVVLDEVDRFLDFGFMPSVEEILRNPKSVLVGQRKAIMFLSEFPAIVQSFASTFLSNCIRIVDNINHPEELLAHAGLKNLNAAAQSNIIHTFMLKLENKYKVVKDAIINDDGDIGILKKTIKFGKMAKRHGMKKRDSYDICRISCTISSGIKKTQYFFNNSTATKLLVNISNKWHSTAILIEKVGKDYKYTSFDPNHGQTIEMTQVFCKSFNPKLSNIRTVRCVSGEINNTNDRCFSDSWQAIFQCFLGIKSLDDHVTQFDYDFISIQKIPI